MLAATERRGMRRPEDSKQTNTLGSARAMQRGGCVQEREAWLTTAHTGLPLIALQPS